MDNDWVWHTWSVRFEVTMYTLPVRYFQVPDTHSKLR